MEPPPLVDPLVDLRHAGSAARPRPRRLPATGTKRNGVYGSRHRRDEGPYGETRACGKGSRRVSQVAERLARSRCDRRPGFVRVGVRGVRYGPSPSRRAAGNAKSEPTRPVLLAMVSLVALVRRYRPEASLRNDDRPPALAGGYSPVLSVYQRTPRRQPEGALVSGSYGLLRRPEGCRKGGALPAALYVGCESG